MQIVDISNFVSKGIKPFFLFVFVFAGPCDENDETYTCDLAPDEEFNKCINEEFVCLGINPCGNNTDCPDVDMAEAMTWWESLLNLLRTLAIFLGIIVCFMVIGNFVEARYHGSGKISKLPIIRCIYDRLSKCRNTQVMYSNGLSKYPYHFEVSILNCRSRSYKFQSLLNFIWLRTK